MENLNKLEYIFLLCSERSGSNFITKLMNNHSDICGPSTKHIINPLARNYFRYQPLTDNHNWNQLISDLLNLYNASFSIWKSKIDKDELLSSVREGDFLELINYFFKKETYSNYKKYCFVKEIKAYEFYSFLKKYIPKAKFVYQVRDPRDMALSWKKNRTHKGGVIAAARQWKNDQQQYLKIKALEEDINNIVFVYYESLVNNTEEELKNILKITGLDYESKMIEMGQDSLTTQNANQQKAWENLSKPVMKDNFNKYKTALSDMEISYIEKIAYFEMRHLGYEPQNSWDSLNQINESEIEAYHQYELTHLEYNPVKGVKENMQAKKRFYQKL